MATIGVPIKVLHEAEGHVVTVETTTGEVSWDRLTTWYIDLRPEAYLAHPGLRGA
jgi:hypothetical protein